MILLWLHFIPGTPVCNCLTDRSDNGHLPITLVTADVGLSTCYTRRRQAADEGRVLGRLDGDSDNDATMEQQSTSPLARAR